MIFRMLEDVFLSVKMTVPTCKAVFLVGEMASLVGKMVFPFGKAAFLLENTTFLTGKMGGPTGKAVSLLGKVANPHGHGARRERFGAHGVGEARERWRVIRDCP